MSVSDPDSLRLGSWSTRDKRPDPPAPRLRRRGGARCRHATRERPVCVLPPCARPGTADPRREAQSPKLPAGSRSGSSRAHDGCHAAMSHASQGSRVPSVCVAPPTPNVSAISCPRSPCASGAFASSAPTCLMCTRQSSLPPSRERAASPASDGRVEGTLAVSTPVEPPDTFWLAMARPIPMSCCAGSCPGVGSGLSGFREMEYTMKATVVRYQVKPEQAAENQELIEAVFAELEEARAGGLHLQGLPTRGRRELHPRGDRARHR